MQCFPWMTVQENIAFGPKSQKKSQSEVNSLVDQYLNLIEDISDDEFDLPGDTDEFEELDF